jgi:hypothetical protein
MPVSPVNDEEPTMIDQLSREELFLLLWDRPTEEVASELGISRVALAKRCKKLLIPKPPPGYWAKIRAGKQSKKPHLKQFSELLIERQRARAKRNRVKRGSLPLTPVQAEIFQRAVDELAEAGFAFGEMEITSSGVRLLDAELAAQFLMLIQNRYAKWLKDRAGDKEVAHASIRSVQALTLKLLPLAKPHTLILEQEPGRSRDENGPKIIIRLTQEFRQQVANLYQLVRENNLSYLTWDLGPFEHAWIVQYHYDDYTSAHSQLCISRDFLWVDCRVKHYSYGDYEEEIGTKKIPLSDITPVDLLPKDDVVVPAVVELPKLAISKKRIKAFTDVENAHDILSSAVYGHEHPAPDEHLVLLEKLYLGCETEGPLTAARNVCRKLEDDMERWELAMESEREAICSEALGLNIGDTILTECRGKSIRLKINQMSVHFSNGKLNFYIAGRRYRKDGILGKREDSVYISTVSAKA